MAKRRQVHDCVQTLGKFIESSPVVSSNAKGLTAQGVSGLFNFASAKRGILQFQQGLGKTSSLLPRHTTHPIGLCRVCRAHAGVRQRYNLRHVALCRVVAVVGTHPKRPVVSKFSASTNEPSGLLKTAPASSRASRALLNACRLVLRALGSPTPLQNSSRHSSCPQCPPACVTALSAANTSSWVGLSFAGAVPSKVAGTITHDVIGSPSASVPKLTTSRPNCEPKPSAPSFPFATFQLLCSPSRFTSMLASSAAISELCPRSPASVFLPVW